MPGTFYDRNPAMYPKPLRRQSGRSYDAGVAQALTVNLSLTRTAKRHGTDPIELLRAILLKAEHTPLDALYQPEAITPHDSS